MRLTRNALQGLGLVTCVLAVACDAAGPDGRGIHSQVRIDLRELVPARLQGIPISVIDAVTLTIDPSNGEEQTLQEPATLADPSVTFDVTIETGTAAFAAAVLSNNGTTLSSGETEADIQEDGFSVALDLVAQRPVLALSTDSLKLIGDGVGSLVVSNIGASTLEWSAQPVDGVEMTPASGSIAADTSQVVDVISRGGVPPGEAILVRFQSAEGELEAKIQGIDPVFAVAVTPDEGSADAPDGGGTGLEAGFVVRNTGNAADTYTITCTGDGAVTCTGTSAASVPLESGDSATVTAVYDVASGAGGTLILTATGNQTSDQGQYVIFALSVSASSGQPGSAATGSSAASVRTPSTRRTP